MAVVNPCYGCQKRKVIDNRSCHGTCLDYAKFSEQKERERKERLGKNSFTDYKQNVFEKIRRRRHEK